MSLTHGLNHNLESLHESNPERMVFVLDEDVSVRRSLELLIRDAGWQPRTFARGQEFLAEPQAAVPSCLVLNVTLPDVHGLDLQKRAAVDHPNMSIIFMTDQPDIYTTVRAMKAGAVDFLTKPVRDQALLDAIAIGIERDVKQRATVRLTYNAAGVPAMPLPPRCHNFGFSEFLLDGKVEAAVSGVRPALL